MACFKESCPHFFLKQLLTDCPYIVIFNLFLRTNKDHFIHQSWNIRILTDYGAIGLKYWFNTAFQIRWAEQLFAKSRVKRYPTPDPDASLERVKRIEISKEPEDPRLPRAEGRRKREIDRPLFNDELWGEEWYLVSQFSHGPNFLILRENLRTYPGNVNDDEAPNY